MRPPTLFVATSLAEVPAGVRHFASVDGSVPGAADTWDHHVSGEPVNLDAMPARVDASVYDGVATTLADADAVISAAVLLRGGTRTVDAPRLAVLRSAAHWCDHLRPAPDDDEAVAHAGLGLARAIDAELGAGRARRERFAHAVRWLVAALEAPGALPFADESPTLRERAQRLVAQGRLDTTAFAPVALVDLRGGESVPPLAVYGLHRCVVAVTVDDHPRGGVRYTVGVNPFSLAAPATLEPALRALAAAEHAHGPPAIGPEPVPGAENWGGRATVFGSPWNYGSRLGVADVCRAVAATLDA